MNDIVAGTLEPPADAETALAVEAVIWGVPLMMMGLYLDAVETGPVEFNRFYMSTAVADATSGAIGPNIDTLNGRAWLDLGAGPQVVGVPATGDRYYSIQFQDMYMNSFAYLGTRTTGNEAGAFVIVSPDHDGPVPDGMPVIRATTRNMLLMVRTLVSGQDDLAAAMAINTGFTLGPLDAYPSERRAPHVASGALDIFQPACRRGASRQLPHDALVGMGIRYFDDLDRLVQAFPPLPDDAQTLERFVPLGIGADETMRLPPALEQVMAASVPTGIAAAQAALETWSDNGWSRRRNVESFIADPVQRAANNIFGPNTQIALESIFFNKRQGPDGLPLSGANRYRLYFPAGQLPPVDAFWSLTLYDRRYMLFDNPLDRYGITDRTAGLRYGSDGSLEILIQTDPPATGTANWLPTPPDTFQLILRTYRPREALLDRSYRPPPLEIAGHGNGPRGTDGI